MVNENTGLAGCGVLRMRDCHNQEVDHNTCMHRLKNQVNCIHKGNDLYM